MRAVAIGSRAQNLSTMALVAALALLGTACGTATEEVTTTEGAGPSTTVSEEPTTSADTDTTVEESDPWPAEPVIWVIPAGPGSTIDRLMRGAEPYLAESLGVPVVIENHEGGAFTVGMQQVLDQPADGSTVFVFVDPFFTGARLQMGVSADSFAYLGGVAIDAPAILGGPDRFDDLNDVIAALENGETVLFGVLPGDPAWAGLLEILNILEIENEPEYVAYAEGGELRVDLLGGHVDMIIGNHDGFIPIHQAGDGRFLVYFSQDRYEDTPDVPTAGDVVVANGGDPDAAPVLSITRMFSVRSEVAEDYPERVEVLSQAIMDLTENDEFLSWAEGEGLVIQWVPPETVAEGTVAFEQLYDSYPEVLGQ